MTLREAFDGVLFRKGSWRIWFDADDETEFFAESIDDLESLWNEFANENNIKADTVERVFETFDPYYGRWFGNNEDDREFVVREIKSMFDKQKCYDFYAFDNLVLRAAIEYINRADVKEDFWVDGIEIREEN